MGKELRGEEDGIKVKTSPDMAACLKSKRPLLLRETACRGRRGHKESDELAGDLPVGMPILG